MKESSFWGDTVPILMNYYSVAIFVLLWVGFAVALVVNREWFDIIWNFVRELPLVAQIIVWILFLPIMVGLWIWESSWHVLIRLLGFAGIVGWTILAVSNFKRYVLNG